MKDKNGFTLVELLAVVLILGIIMAVSIPTVSRWIDRGKQESRESQKQTLLIGLLILALVKLAMILVIIKIGFFLFFSFLFQSLCYNILVFCDEKEVVDYYFYVESLCLVKID